MPGCCEKQELRAKPIALLGSCVTVAWEGGNNCGREKVARGRRVCGGGVVEGFGGAA